MRELIFAYAHLSGGLASEQTNASLHYSCCLFMNIFQYALFMRVVLSVAIAYSCSSCLHSYKVYNPIMLFTVLAWCTA